MCQAIWEMREEERMKGEKIGEARQNELTKRLLQGNRLEDLRRAVDNRSFREQLFIEYRMKEKPIF